MKTSSIWIWGLGIGGITVVLAMMALSLLPNSKWQTAQNRIAAMRREAEQRNVTRPVVRGEPTTGNGWTDYAIALDDARTWNEDPNGAKLDAFLQHRPQANRSVVEQMTRAHADTLARWREGTRHEGGQYPYEWSRGSEAKLPSLLATRKMALLAIAQARLWRESGRGKDAAELLLDTAAFAGDVSSNGVLLTDLIGLSVFSRAFDEIHELLLSGTLTPTDLTAMGRELEIVDRGFPWLGDILANETATLGTSMTGFPAWFGLMRQGGWRYAFSFPNMAGEYFEFQHAFLDRARDFEDMDFASARQLAKDHASGIAKSSNPLITLYNPDITRALVQHREMRARLRLLRAGAAFLATGALPVLGDPCGASLMSERRDNVVRIWSVGIDGEDQGGTGGWKFHEKQADIVLDLQRS